MKKLVVVGQGYVGLPLAMTAVRAGFDVVGLDNDESRVERLQAGDSYIEDIEDAAVLSALAGRFAGTYKVTSDPTEAKGFDFAVITVPTPLRDGNPDMTYVESAGRTLAEHVTPGCTVVLESTTYPGSTEDLLVPLLEAGSGLKAGTDFLVGYSPERIDPGNKTWTFERTPKIVSGINEASRDAVAVFYGQLVDVVVPVSSCKAAELAKLYENTFRTVNIALVNELALHSTGLGIDVWETLEAAATKPFGFMKFTPGPGVGGHCLPIDPTYLAWQVKQVRGEPFRFIHLANDVNERMPKYIADRVLRGMNKRRKALQGSRVLCLGVAYKKDSRDTRESPALNVLRQLQEYGPEIRVVDPHVRALPKSLSDVALVPLSVEEIAEADVVVICTDHSAIDYDLVVRHAQYIFDARHCCRPAENVEFL